MKLNQYQWNEMSINFLWHDVTLARSCHSKKAYFEYFNMIKWMDSFGFSEYYEDIGQFQYE